MCRQTSNMSLRAVGSDPLIAPPFKCPGGMWACLPTARQSVLFKKLYFQGFQGMRIATKGTKHKEDAGLRPRQCAVATPQGRALLVRGFRRGVDRRTTDGRPYRFAMTEIDFVYSLRGHAFACPLTQITDKRRVSQVWPTVIQSVFHFR